MRKVNITLEVSDIRLTDLENFLDRNYGLIDFRILPDTKDLYKEDKVFKKLVDLHRHSRKAIDNYINLNND